MTLGEVPCPLVAVKVATTPPSLLTVPLITRLVRAVGMLLLDSHPTPSSSLSSSLLLVLSLSLSASLLLYSRLGKDRGENMLHFQFPRIRKY